MYKRILVPVDGSTTSMNCLEKAIRLAKLSQDQRSQTADSACSRWHRLFPRSRHVHRERRKIPRVGQKTDQGGVENLTGRAAYTIVKEANKWKADVIVMGTHGRRGLNRLVLGSDAELVVRTASVPVLLVPPSKASRRGGKKKPR